MRDLKEKLDYLSEKIWKCKKPRMYYYLCPVENRAVAVSNKKVLLARTCVHFVGDNVNGILITKKDIEKYISNISIR